EADRAGVGAGELGHLSARQRRDGPRRSSYGGHGDRRGRITGRQEIARGDRESAVEYVRELSAGLAGRDIREARQRPEREQVRLRAVAHRRVAIAAADLLAFDGAVRSEEHTSELQSPYDLVCRLLLEKKKI